MKKYLLCLIPLFFIFISCGNKKIEVTEIRNNGVYYEIEKFDFNNLDKSFIIKIENHSGKVIMFYCPLQDAFKNIDYSKSYSVENVAIGKVLKEHGIIKSIEVDDKVYFVK